MSYGKLLPDQIKALRPIIQGRHVHDLGAGDGELSLALLQLGAAKVTAVDRNKIPTAPGVECRQAYFENVRDAIDIAFVSWPSNRPDGGLLSLIRRAREVVYLGKNTDGTACGSRPFFRALQQREVRAYVPNRENTLIIYGADTGVLRRPTPEELAGLDLEGRILSYSHIETLAEPDQ